MSDNTLEAVLEMAMGLSTVEKVRLMERLAVSVENELAEPSANPLLMMAEAADRLGLRADRDDISEHFDDILRQSWSEHLDRKRPD